jgi:NitT/TauT family transport system substrate-binding protein
MHRNKGISISRRQALQLTTGAASIIVTGAVTRALSSPALAQNRTVTLQIGGPTIVHSAGEIAARKLGYYRDIGLDVQLVPGGVSNDGISSVAAGKSEFGKFYSSSQVMLARAAGVPIQAIGIGYQKHPFTFFSRKRSPVRTAADFVGKKIATQPTSKPLLSAAFKLNKVDPKLVDIVPMAYDLNQLLVGQVDVATTWQTNTEALRPLGDDRVDLLLWDLGVRLYAQIYYVTEAMLQKNFPMVKSFMEATGRGWEYVYNNHEAAAEAIVESYPNLDHSAQLDAIKVAMKFMFNEATKTKGWGTMELNGWASQIKIYDDLGEFKGAPAPKLDELVSMKLLEETASTRPRIG